MKVAGLMSGTSMDGIDAAILEVEGRGRGGSTGRPAWRLLAFRTSEYTAAQAEEIRRAIAGSARDVCLLHARLGEWLAEALLEACRTGDLDPAELAAVGSHGHTLWHHPPSGTERGASLQVGCPATVAERTGVPVVSDLRARDLAAGGHGAPLVGWADRILFAHPERVRAVQNLGGMGNVTRLPPAAGEPDDHDVMAFDTGPGVALIDAAAEWATGGRERFDRDGRMAARGRVDEALLDRLMDHPFLREPPPRSTGREVFGEAMVRDLSGTLEPGRPGEWEDLLATLTEFTARSVADAYRRWLSAPEPDEVFLTGGGARNPVLVDALRKALHPLPVRSGEELPLDPDAREAAAFALLAWAHLEGVPSTLAKTTGAAGPRVLGSFTPAGERWP